jgi:hypothetical protein
VSKLVISATLLLIAAPLAAQTPAPAAATPAPAVRQKLPNDSLEMARKYAGWIWSNQFDSLIAHSVPEGATPEARQRLAEQTPQIAARAGIEQSVVEERWVRRNGNRQYWRVARFTDFTDEPLVLRLVIMPDGKIAGMGFGPLSQVPPIDPEP